MQDKKDSRSGKASPERAERLERQAGEKKLLSDDSEVGSGCPTHLKEPAHRPAFRPPIPDQIPAVTSLSVHRMEQAQLLGPAPRWPQHYRWPGPIRALPERMLVLLHETLEGQKVTLPTSPPWEGLWAP